MDGREAVVQERCNLITWEVHSLRHFKCIILAWLLWQNPIGVLSVFIFISELTLPNAFCRMCLLKKLIVLEGRKMPWVGLAPPGIQMFELFLNLLLEHHKLPSGSRAVS